MDIQKTPPLPDWLKEHYPFQRKTANLDGVKIHFVDEGVGDTVFLLHGNPSWSFLWRKVIKQLLSKGFRVVAPDLMGLGLSDKPKKVSEHSLERHVHNMSQLVIFLDLNQMIIGAQDWGGPISAGMAARNPQRIRAVLFGNTAILKPKTPIKTTSFHRFSHFPLLSEVAFRGFNFPIHFMKKVQGDKDGFGSLEKRAYLYPFRKWAERAAPLAFARMVPGYDSHPSIKILEETDQWIRNFKGPVALVWGKKDPVLGRALYRLQKAVPQAKVVETDAGHFLQEEVPDELAKAILELSQC